MKKLKPRVVWFFGILCFLTGGGCTDRAAEKEYWIDPTVPPGLHVDLSSTSDSGRPVPVLSLGRKPYRATGVNCYDLFNGTVIYDDKDSAFRFDPSHAYATLDRLKAEGVPVVRFNCGMYYDTELPAVIEYGEQYFATLKKIAEYAETCRIGLIPSLFWHFAAVPRYFGEPCRSWGHDTSRTLEFMKTYTRRVVETLQGCKSIFAWEFGNEFNLEADLPNWQEIYKTDDPDNCLTADDVQYAYETFVQTVRAVDSTGRLICSGNAALRPSQYHQYVEHSWTADTPQQYAEITRKLNPDGMCSVSEHIYDRERKVGPYDSLLDLDGQLALARDAAHSMGKIYYVGEFAGVLPSEADYRIFYDAFLRAGVPLSLVWNFSMKGNIEHSFTAESDRGKYIFALIREYNEKLNAVQ